MQEKVEELYKKYIDVILNVVFNDIGSTVVENRHYEALPEDLFLTEPNIKYKEYDSVNDRIIVTRYIDGNQFHCEYNIMDMDGNLLFDKWYDLIFRLNDGYAVVKDNGKYNYITENGSFLLDEWVDDIEQFSEGYGVIKKGIDYSIINKNGEIVFTTNQYEICSECHEGFFKVRESDNKYNLIDIKGNFLIKGSHDWVKYVSDFNDGLAVVSDYYQDYCVDANGKIVSKKWKFPHDFTLSRIEPFHDGWAAVVLKKDGKFYDNFINKNGELLFALYNDIDNFNDRFDGGYAKIRCKDKSGKVYYIVVSKDGKEYKYKDEFYTALGEGMVALKRKNGYYIVGEDGIPINKKPIDYIDEYDDEFSNGKIMVFINNIGYILSKNGDLKTLPLLKGAIKRYPTYYHYDNGPYIYMDENGFNTSRVQYRLHELSPGIFKAYSDRSKGSGEKWKLVSIDNDDISDDTFSYIGKFYEGWAMVSYPYNFYNYIDKDGNFLFKNNIDWMKPSSVKYGCIKVTKDDKTSYLDLNGNYMFPFTKGTVEVYANFINYKDKIKPRKIEMGKYIVKNNPFGHFVSNGEKRFKLQYEPVKAFGDRYILCFKDSDVIMFDAFLNEYKTLCKVSEIEYDDNLIFINKTSQIYLMHGTEMIDITEYYNKNLLNKKEIHINENIKIISKDKFRFDNEDDIRRLYEEEQAKIENEKRERERIEEEKRIEELRIVDEEERAKKEKEQTELVELIAQLLFKLASYEKETGKIMRVEAQNVLISVGDHKEINPIYLSNGRLKYIDLSVVSFKNVKVSGVDFSRTNAYINPQEVYPKGSPDLSNCNFEGIYFPGSTNFCDVNVCGSKFTCDNQSSTFDINPGCFAYAIYDDNTTLNGVPLKELIEEKDYDAK